MKHWLNKHIRGDMTDDEYRQWKEDLIAVVAGFAALIMMVWLLTL